MNENEPKKIKKRVACYIRVSTTDQIDMYWPDIQISKIKSFLELRWQDMSFVWESLDLNDDYIFFDGWISWADKIETRPALSRLFDILDYSVGEKPFDIVLVYKIDRFARDLKVLLDIVERLKKHNVWFISTQESIDTSSAFGNAMLWILWVFAELEREMIKERTSLGVEESVKAWKPKKVPYGRRKDEVTWRPTIYEEEAKIVREIFERVEWWEIISSIINDLIKRKVKVPTASGSDTSHLTRLTDIYKWEDSTVRKILTNKFHIGLLYYDKSVKEKIDWKTKITHLKESQWKLSPIKHELLISEDVFNTVQTFIDSKKWNFHKSEKNYLLSWFIKCWYCEEHRPVRIGCIEWSWTWWWWKSWFYHCSGKKSKNKVDWYSCPTVQLWKNELEELVITEIKWLFNNLDTLNKYITSKNNRVDVKSNRNREFEAINNKIIQVKKSLENLEYLWSEWAIESVTLIAKYEEKKKELKELLEKQRIVSRSINKLLNDESQKKAFKIIKEIISQDFDNLFSDKEKLKKFLYVIVKDIYIYSRDKNENDVIRWKTMSTQKIPYKMKIRFKLPQEFLKEFFKSNVDIIWENKI